MSSIQPPLVVSLDQGFVSHAQRWFAAVSANPEIGHDAAFVRRHWRDAPAVLVGEDQVEHLISLRLPRRDHVLLVTEEPELWWARGLSLGAGAVYEPNNDDAIVSDLAAALDGSAEACTISVVGAAGGLGASVLATALGIHGAARGARSLVVDTDHLGGGIDLLAGAEHSEGVRWSDLALADGHIAPASLTEVLPRARGASLLTFGREHEVRVSATAVLSAAVRGFDLVVADVDRHAFDVNDELAIDVLARSISTVVIVPETVRGIVAGRAILTQLAPLTSNPIAVTRAVHGGIGHRATARQLSIPCVARMSHDRSLTSALEQGLGPERSRSVRKVCAAILDAVGVEAGVSIDGT